MVHRVSDRITWVGHSTVLVELDGVRVLTDPVVRDRIGPLRRIVPPVSADLTEAIDAVVLSHLHNDHVDLGSLRRIGSATPTIAPRGSARWLAARGLSDVRELSPGEGVELDGVRISATRAVHDGRRPFGPSADAIGVVIGGSRAVYFASDTDLFPELEELAGTVDVALLPVWGWGHRLGPGHLDPERAALAARLIAPAAAIPIHWGTLAPVRPLPRLADSERPARDFAAHMAQLAPGVEVLLLRPGEHVCLEDL